MAEELQLIPIGVCKCGICFDADIIYDKKFNLPENYQCKKCKMILSRNGVIINTKIMNGGDAKGEVDGERSVTC